MRNGPRWEGLCVRNLTVLVDYTPLKVAESLPTEYDRVENEATQREKRGSVAGFLQAPAMRVLRDDARHLQHDALWGHSAGHPQHQDSNSNSGRIQYQLRLHRHQLEPPKLPAGSNFPGHTMESSYFKLEDGRGLKAKIDERAPDLFKARKGKPQLEVKRCLKKKPKEGMETVHIERNWHVENMFDIKALRHELKNSPQFFIIRQEHTYTTLNISRELFIDLLDIYGVFSHFWKVAFTFGRKSEQNEFAFPGIRAQRSRACEPEAAIIYESACVLRRVELHNRELQEGQPPWSIRQTGVYHKLSAPAGPIDFPPTNPVKSSEQPNSMFILMAPSQNFEAQLSQSLDLSVVDDRAIGPWNIYRLLIADCLSGWLDYMTWLEDGLKEQSRGIIYAKVGAEKENLSPLTDFTINFLDRQNLKLLEDYIIDLQAILPTLLDTIMGIREQCRNWCNKYHLQVQSCNCEQILEEFDEQVKEVQGHVKRAEALKERARSTTQLLSDLLSYEDAIQLKDVASQTYEESKSMSLLTARSTRDAAAVKILTIIGLIYLPSSIVANFFSTQFVHTDGDGNLTISGNAWILAACVLPLTVATIAIWWLWVRCTNVDKPETSQQPHIQKVMRQNSFRSLLSLKRGWRLHDPELGEVPGKHGVDTWASNATTAVTGKIAEG